jgi:hypothetical protein
MKRIGTFLLLLGVGCTSLRGGDQLKPPAKTPGPPTRPVMVEDVNEKDPREAARRLDAEIQSEEQKK